MTTPNKDADYGVLMLDCDQPLLIMAGSLEAVEHELKDYAATRKDRLLRFRLRCGAPAAVLASHVYGFSLSTDETRSRAEYLDALNGDDNT